MNGPLALVSWSETTKLVHVFPSGHRLFVAMGDLTEYNVEAIVNAANARLNHVKGLAGAIVDKGWTRSICRNLARIQSYQ